MWTLDGGSQAASQEPEDRACEVVQDRACEVVPRQVTVAAHVTYSLNKCDAVSARLFISGCNRVTKALSLL